MNREIKFRAWDGVAMSNTFEITNLKYGFLNNGDGVHCYQIDYGDCKVMQYTGLKDKNGKEIYEGDIVRVMHSHDDFKMDTFSITYELGGFCLQQKDSEPTSLGFYFWGLVEHKFATGWGECDGKAFEIIGNIHENPELLT